MGRKQPTTTPSKAEPLETVFRCPFCKHSDTVECTIDLKRKVATAACCVCEESYSTKAHALTEPVDVYADWIDDCHRSNDSMMMVVDECCKVASEGGDTMMIDG